LAGEQLRAALEGMEKTDTDRKDALYHLALVHEAQANTDEAVACLREIFSIDVNYLDVSQRLQTHYQAKKGT
jgi:tetratricopeptide (TPR) repeat protein